MMGDHGNIPGLGGANSVLGLRVGHVDDWRCYAFFFFVVGFGLSELT